MKCPKCGTEMVWMGNVQIEIKDTDKYFHHLTKTAFRSKDVELWGVDWDNGDLFCPNYLKCGNHPVIKNQKKARINMNIFNNKERKIKCINKYDTSPYSCDYELLEIGKEYTVVDIHVHGWFTMIELKEFPNKEFNSVLFEDLIEESEE